MVANFLHFLLHIYPIPFSPMLFFLMSSMRREGNSLPTSAAIPSSPIQFHPFNWKIMYITLAMLNYRIFLLQLFISLQDQYFDGQASELPMVIDRISEWIGWSACRRKCFDWKLNPQGKADSSKLAESEKKLLNLLKIGNNLSFKLMQDFQWELSLFKCFSLVQSNVS